MISDCYHGDDVLDAGQTVVGDEAADDGDDDVVVGLRKCWLMYLNSLCWW